MDDDGVDEDDDDNGDDNVSNNILTTLVRIVQIQDVSCILQIHINRVTPFILQ